MLRNGDFYLSNFDLNNHYEENILRIEKYDDGKIWTVVLFDADNQGYPYLKRFLMEASKRKQNFVGDNASSHLVILSDQAYPLIRVAYGGVDAARGSEEIDAEQFVAVKGYKAKGKRISTWQIESIEELEPTRFPEVPESPENPESPEIPDSPENPESPENPAPPSENLDPDAGKSQRQIIDEMTGQLSFDF